MGLNLNYQEGQTPIDEDEKAGLRIRSISTMAELDQFEQQNIEAAIQWTYGRSFTKDEVLDVDFIRAIHRRMFQDVWKWAGEFRNSNKNLGVHFSQIRIQLGVLLEDCNFWIEKEVFPAEEIGVRFKHRMVSIHLFPNGNGRHSRLMGEILLKAMDPKKSFTWGQKSLRKGEDRRKYLEALKLADAGEIGPLVEFAKS